MARVVRTERFAYIAIAIWVVFTAVIVARHPHGVQWLFVVVAPFYIAYFVVQIRRARAERQQS